MKNNKQKLVVIFVALTFLLGLSTFAVAEGGKWQKKKGVQFSALGEVTAVNTTLGEGTLSLKLEKANRVLKQEFELGEVVDFLVADNVRAKTEGTEQGDFDLNFFATARPGHMKATLKWAPPSASSARRLKMHDATLHNIPYRSHD